MELRNSGNGQRTMRREEQRTELYYYYLGVRDEPFLELLYRSCVFEQKISVTRFFFRTALGDGFFCTEHSRGTGTCSNYVSAANNVLYPANIKGNQPPPDGSLN